MALPTVFWNHGGGPMSVLGHPSQATVVNHLKGASKRIPKPSAIVIATAHWEAPVVTISTSPQPPMLYDYYGFPPEAYKLSYPAPGSPEVAKRAMELLSTAGIPCAADAARGYDHGTFIPLMLAYPDADIPVVQISLRSDLDPSHHLAVGRALAPLRSEGVLLVGSGLSFHNMQAFRSGGVLSTEPRAPFPPSEAFDAWLQSAVVGSKGEERAKKLAAWASAPGARQSHPREEHLVPLFVAAGAALDEPAHVDLSANVMGAKVSGFVFGGSEA